MGLYLWKKILFFSQRHLWPSVLDRPIKRGVEEGEVGRRRRDVGCALGNLNLTCMWARMLDLWWTSEKLNKRSQYDLHVNALVSGSQSVIIIFRMIIYRYICVYNITTTTTAIIILVIYCSGQKYRDASCIVLLQVIEGEASCSRVQH